MNTGYLIAAFSAALILVPVGAAQSQPEIGPGMIGADSPLYGIEVAWDNAAVSVGVKAAGAVAQERAAEAQAAAEKGNWNAAQRAADNMASVAKKARNNETEGLQKAESVLQGVMDDAPEEARQGLQTALDNVGRERRRAGGNSSGKPGNERAPGTFPSEEENSNISVEERTDKAREIMERGRQDLRQGNNAMDNGNFTAAEEEFGQASRRFEEAIKGIEGMDTAESDRLLQQLRDAKSTAEDARSQAETQIGSAGNESGQQSTTGGETR